MGIGDFNTCGKFNKLQFAVPLDSQAKSSEAGVVAIPLDDQNYRTVSQVALRNLKLSSSG